MALVPAEDGDTAALDFVIDLVRAAEALRCRYEAPTQPLHIAFAGTVHARTMLLQAVDEYISS